MKKTVWFGIAGVMVCLVAGSALGQCCGTAAKAADETAKPEAKAALCAMAGDCQFGGALSKLELSDEQKVKIAAITKETGCDQKPAEGACPKALSAKRKACNDKVMAVLTDEQKAQIAKLCPKGKCPKKDG